MRHSAGRQGIPIIGLYSQSLTRSQTKSLSKMIWRVIQRRSSRWSKRRYGTLEKTEVSAKISQMLLYKPRKEPFSYLTCGQHAVTLKFSHRFYWRCSWFSVTTNHKILVVLGPNKIIYNSLDYMGVQTNRPGIHCVSKY